MQVHDYYFLQSQTQNKSPKVVSINLYLYLSTVVRIPRPKSRSSVKTAVLALRLSRNPLEDLNPCDAEQSLIMHSPTLFLLSCLLLAANAMTASIKSNWGHFCHMRTRIISAISNMDRLVPVRSTVQANSLTC